MRCQPSTSVPPSASALLDPPIVCQLLADHLQLEQSATLLRCRVDRCWPVGSSGLIFQWSFQDGTGDRFAIYGRYGCGADDRPPPARPHDPVVPRVSPAGLRGVFVTIPDWKLTLHSPDCDPAMPHLAACLDGAPLARTFPATSQATSPTHSADRPATCSQLLGYKPGRRATMRLEELNSSSSSGRGRLWTAAGRWVAKTYHDDRGAALARLHDCLSSALPAISGGRVGVLPAAGVDRELRTIVFPWIEGRAFDRAAACSQTAITTAVQAMGALHRVSVGEEWPTFGPADECAVLRRWCNALALVDHRAVARINGILTPILAVADRIPLDERCTVHRDFHEGQLLAASRRTVLLDLDTLSRGHPCIDLGNYLAHLYLAWLRCGRETQPFEVLQHTVVNAYTEAFRQVDHRVLSFYLASSLLRLGMVHALRTRTRRFAGALWRRSEAVLRAAEGRKAT